MTLDSTKFTPDVLVMAGYRLAALVTMEIIISGMRIALTGELKSIKMLVDPENCDPEDLELLGTLKEPHIKLVTELCNYIDQEILNKYRIINALDDEEVLENESVEDTAAMLFNRFIFQRIHHRRRDRYVNFNKVLFTSQRALYEWCKLMLTGETRALDMTYRCNYSPNSLKKLTKDCSSYNVQLIAELITTLQDYEEKSKAIPL